MLSMGLMLGLVIGFMAWLTCIFASNIAYAFVSYDDVLNEVAKLKYTIVFGVVYLPVVVAFVWRVISPS